MTQETKELALVVKDGEVRFEVHAKPRAKKSAILGTRTEGALDVSIAAPPVDGAANDELVRLLAKALGIPKAGIRVVRGESSRHKVVGVTGLDPAELRERLRLGR